MKCNLTKLNTVEIERLNRPIFIEIPENLLKHCLYKSTRPRWFHRALLQNLQRLDNTNTVNINMNTNLELFQRTRKNF